FRMLPSLFLPIGRLSSGFTQRFGRPVFAYGWRIMGSGLTPSIRTESLGSSNNCTNRQPFPGRALGWRSLGDAWNGWGEPWELSPLSAKGVDSGSRQAHVLSTLRSSQSNL